ncbi:MAG: NAD-dependent deacylase [Chitinophagales bacterium]|nr:NAD-dependent deacylase [Chitinophagales bacterium]
MNKKKIVILTGAGVSAESGIKTFRDQNGLWENHRVEDVASPEGFARNPDLVYDFYNKRRRQLIECEPNAAHFALASLEKDFNTFIITQNVDDLHERAGSTQVIHLHGELFKVRSVDDPYIVMDWKKDLTGKDKGPDGHRLRPHIVWFGEAVPMIEDAIDVVRQADLLMTVGTSLQVYPAASLMHYADSNIPMYYIDPHADRNYNGQLIKCISEKATIGVPLLVDNIKKGQIF